MSAIRAMTIAQRIEQWEALNSALAEMEEAAFERRFPDLKFDHKYRRTNQQNYVYSASHPRDVEFEEY